MSVVLDNPSFRKFIVSGGLLLVCLALAKLAIHLAVNAAGGYGYFRDELYYLACSDHLSWGYVDQPPFSIVVLWLSRLWFGDSIVALRFLPAVAGAAVVVLTGLMVKEFGGSRYATLLAAVAVIVAPHFLGTNSYYSMNSFDLLFWVAAVYLMIVALKKDRLWHWALLGVVLGLGLQNKIGVLWLGAGFVVGLLLTQHRRLFITGRLWLAGGIAVAIFAPYVVWNWANHWPTLEFMHNAVAHKYVAVSPWYLFSQQVVMMQPISVVVWVSGLLYLLLAKQMRQFRCLAIIYCVVFAILVMNGNSKAEYIAPFFPVLFAAGAIAIDQGLGRIGWRWMKAVLVVLLVLGGVVLAPFALPVLPVEKFIAYEKMLGVTPATAEKKELRNLPQFYADMFGWPEMVAEIARVYQSLTPAEQADCLIGVRNYGEAGAVDFFGPAYHLPKATCSHNNYWFWGVRSAPGSAVHIRVGESLDELQKGYRDVTLAGRFENAYCMPYENNLPIYICRQPLFSLEADWPQAKHFQ